MDTACVRMPGVVVLGILMVARLYGTNSEAVSLSKLLLFNNATASIEVTAGPRCTPYVLTSAASEMHTRMQQVHALFGCSHPTLTPRFHRHALGQERPTARLPWARLASQCCRVP